MPPGDLTLNNLSMAHCDRRIKKIKILIFKAFRKLVVAAENDGRSIFNPGLKATFLDATGFSCVAVISCHSNTEKAECS